MISYILKSLTLIFLTYCLSYILKNGEEFEHTKVIGAGATLLIIVLVTNWQIAIRFIIRIITRITNGLF